MVCCSACGKAKSLGVADEAQEAAERRTRAEALKAERQVVRLPGRDVPILRAGDWTLRANDDGKPAWARGVRSHVTGGRSAIGWTRPGQPVEALASIATTGRVEPRRVPALPAVPA